MPLIDEQAAAIQRKSILSSLSSRVSICCLVSGIRYHDGFAQELHGNPKLPMVTCSLNARAIMSDRVPAMTSPEHFPYCFWHSDVPREETLRHLLTQCLGNTLLRYRVGGACAVGGNTTLYHEFRLLPEVASAEEALNNPTSAHAIYKAIMKAPVRCA